MTGESLSTRVRQLILKILRQPMFKMTHRLPGSPPFFRMITSFIILKIDTAGAPCYSPAMNLIVHIPDEHAARVSAVDPARLERAALEAVLRAAGEGAEAPHALAGIATDLSPQEAAAQMRAARPGNPLPPDISIRDLATFGRA